MAQKQKEKGILNCYICGYKITNKGAVMDHMNLHSQLSNLQCVFCKKELKTKEGLQYHVSFYVSI